MILAEKIMKLRKQSSWSQEELAEKMNVSRQSVSKWENATSIPDLNKIILMAEIFSVSTDYLLKDEIENVQTIGVDYEPDNRIVTLEEAKRFMETKMEMTKLNAKGALICIYSVIPLLFLLGLAETDNIGISDNIALVIGMTSLLAMVSIGVSIFLKSNQIEQDIEKLENETFELAYGVRSIFKEESKAHRRVYSQRLSIGIAIIIMSVIPLIIAGILDQADMTLLLMLTMMLLFIGIGVYILIPSSAKNSAYNCLLNEGEFTPSRRKETKRIEQFATFYWPLVTAVYIGLSLWTMAWGTTWVIWPVAGIAFAAFAGLISFVESGKSDK